MKKIVAFLLVVVMVLSCLPVLAGSNTAQTRDKINPDIKIDAKLDKTTLDLSKKDEVIKGTITFPIEEKIGYEIDVDDDNDITANLLVTLEYENSKGEIVTEEELRSIWLHVEKSSDEKNQYHVFKLNGNNVKDRIDWIFNEDYWNYDVKFISASVKIPVSGTKYYYEEKKQESFFYEFPAITVKGYDEKKFTIDADKKLVKPGEDITVSYKYSGEIPEGCSLRVCAESSADYSYGASVSLEKLELESKKTEDKFVFTVPATDLTRVSIVLNYWFVGEGYSSYQGRGSINVDVNVTPPDPVKDLVYSPVNDGDTTIVLRKENLETTQRQISITGKTADIVVPTYTWKSSNEKIATVDKNGLVKFLSEGFVEIEGEAKVGHQKYSYSHRFTVVDSTSTERLVYSVADTETIWLKQKAADQKNVTINVTNVDPYGEVPTFIWTSSNPAVATVNGNTVIGVDVGTAVITGTGKIGDAEYTHSFNVVVDKNEGKVTKAKPSSKKISLKAGKKATIKLTFKPDNLFAEPKVTWKSSDKKVATVKKGVIKAKKAGTCTITAKVAGLKKAIKIKVTVK